MMGSIEDNHWIDMVIDEIGFALTKVDELIQKSFELWTELTKDIYDDQPTHDTTGQPNNGISGEEDSSQDKSVAEVKERPTQHRPMCLGDAKETPSQHWAMPASDIPESLIQEQGNDYDEYDYNEENTKEDDQGTVSESSDEHIWELNLKTSIRNHWPNCYYHHIEEANRSSFKWKYVYEQLKKFDMPSEEEDESWDDDYDEEKEEEEEDETTVSKSCENLSKMNHMMRTLGSCYLPPIHPLHEENNGCLILSGGGSYEQLKNDGTSSEEEDDSWDNEEVMEWMQKHGIVSDVMSYESLVVLDGEDEDDDEVSDKLHGFVYVEEEEIGNKSEFGEDETLFPECDWVYVTRN